MKFSFNTRRMMVIISIIMVMVFRWLSGLPLLASSVTQFDVYSVFIYVHLSLPIRMCRKSCCTTTASALAAMVAVSASALAKC